MPPATALPPATTCPRLQISVLAGVNVPIYNFVSMPDETSPPERHKHLRRLSRLWVDDPVFFVTACVADRNPLLACEAAHAILREVWDRGGRLHGWQAGSYVIMPDHVHLFCAPGRKAASLSAFVGGWKEWSTKFLHRRLSLTGFQWQPGFFDHVLRTEESYTQKWDYVRHNPVRAGLAKDADDWPYAGHLHFR